MERPAVSGRADGRPGPGAAISRPWVHSLTGFDALLTAGCLGADLAEALIRAPEQTSPFAYLLVLAAAGPVLFRRMAPLAMLLASAAGAVLCAAFLHDSWTVTATVAIVLFTVARTGGRQRSLAVAVLTATAVTAAVLVIDGKIDLGGLVTRIALICLCVAGGELLRSRQELQSARREKAEQDERARDEQLRQTAVAERMQIARELHDTLAHSLVAINVRASVAIDVPDSQDPAAALEDIKSASASALRDLRSTLSVLREQEDDVPTAPALGLDALDNLIDHARQAGIDTCLDCTVDSAAVSTATGAAVARIVQESLTNVVRHANAHTARVSIRHDGDDLCVQVTDDGIGGAVRGEGGFGIRGMIERAHALGGELFAGPSPTGGWVVDVHLPLSAGRAS